MRKKEIVQQVLDGAGQVFGYRTAERHIANVFSTYVGQLFATNPNNYEFYCKRITLPVSNREAEVTVPLLQLRTNANGVPRIMPTSECDTDTEFYPAPAYALRSGADANHISNMVFYVVQGNTIRFNKSLPESVTEVKADVVLEFHGYDDDDFVNLPSGAAQQIIEASVQAMRAEPTKSNIYKTK